LSPGERHHARGREKEEKSKLYDDSSLSHFSLPLF
jgi:hypothetical protein